MVFTMERLDRINWIHAGISALSEGGVAAVHVELLAKQLGITKGSFYWHFKGREDLLNAILKEWEHSQTASAIAQVTSLGGDAHQQFQHLSKALTQLDLRLEAAIRAWAASDPHGRQTVERIDAVRLAYIRSIIENADIPIQPAQTRARLINYALIGELISGRTDWLQDHQEEINLNRAMLLSPHLITK